MRGLEREDNTIYKCVTWTDKTILKLKIQI